jgi:hypothetical protein
MATVFISYAHEDRELAVWLSNSLRAHGVTPWRDEERLVRGDLQAEITAAIDALECGIFLVSPNWLLKDWCRKEAQLFAARDREQSRITRILICLQPYRELSRGLPPELSGLVGIACDDSADRNEALWKIFCAVTDRDLGDPSQFKQQGALLAVDSAPPVLTTEQAELRGSDAEVFECDRAHEFAMVKKRYEEKGHHLFLVLGPRWEAHEYFVSRIREKLEAKPPHLPVVVSWRGKYPPGSEDLYRERLARALDCRRDAELPFKLRQLMVSRNVVLLHPTIEDEFGDEAIAACFTQWLPRLLDEVKPALRLKCVQPIAWDVPKGMAAASRRWFASKDAPAARGEAEKEAVALVAQIEEKQTSLLPARIPLRPITEEHVSEFCELFNLSESEQALLFKRLSDARAETSDRILGVIERFMDERRGQRAAG